MRSGLIALLISAAIGTAVSENGPSVYSVLGLGDIRNGMGIRSAGMGHTGISFQSGSSISSLTPASWSKTPRTIIEGAYLFENFRTNDGFQNQSLTNNAFDGAGLLFPLSTEQGLTLGIGFVPYSEVAYDITTTGSELGVDYRIRNTGDGGLTTGFVGLSYIPAEHLSVGLGFNLYFGTVDIGRSFTPIVDTLGSGTLNELRTLRGPGLTMGALLTSLEPIHESLRLFSLGFSLTSRAKLSTTTQQTFDFISERDTTIEQSGSVSLPVSLGIGLGYKPADRTQLALEYTTQLWESADLTGFRPGETRNSYRFGLGAERTGSRDVFTSWLNRLTYRLGAFYESTYYLANGQGIDHWGVTGGLGIPLSGENKLDIALEYGQRGTLANNLVKDHILRLGVSFTIGEFWFVRYDPEED